MQKTLLLLFFFISFTAFSQTIFEFDQEKSIQVNGAGIPNPFSQGINSAQIQTMDLTNDGVDDWVIWDINSRQLQVFEKNGENFSLRPELSYLFPADISGFLVLADFDQDGKKDLFTSTPLGIRAYSNTSQGTQISWTLAQNFLRLDGANNIPANNLDTPLLQDIDGDGDLDLVIFNFAQGDYLEFYRNTSVERKGTPDIDGFAFPVRHWGNFEFCACGEFSWGQTCDGRPLDAGARIDENARIQHAGGHSVLYRDFSGDGIPDLLLGRDECSTLYFLPNSGTAAQPLFSSFSLELPEFGMLPEFQRFHVGQAIGDDLVISLNTNEAAANYGIDFANSVVKLEKNTGEISPILQDQLFDLGENVRPFFSGNRFSGRLELTANVSEAGEVAAEAFRLSFDGETFVLEQEDWLELRDENLLDLQLLEFNDSRNSYQQLIVATKVKNGIPRQILAELFETTIREINFSGLTLRVGDQLTFFVYQGKDYLLVAAQNGSLDLHEVNLETRSVTASVEDFLGFADNPANRNLNVAVVNKANPDLYAVDQQGKIVRIANFMFADAREEVLIRIGNQDLPTRLGRNTWITVLPSTFDDQVDLILGSRGGGITYLSSIKSNTPNEGEFLVNVYPNPTVGSFKIITNVNASGRLVSPLGQILRDEILIPANREVEIQGQVLQPGIYFLQLETEDRKVVVKKILVR